MKGRFAIQKLFPEKISNLLLDLDEDFTSYEVSTDFRLLPIPAVVVACRRKEGKFQPVWVGSFDSLSDLPRQKAWDRFAEFGVTHCLVRTEIDTAKRIRMKLLLLSCFRPPLNVGGWIFRSSKDN